MPIVKTHGRSPCPVLLGRTAPHLLPVRPLFPYKSAPYPSFLPCHGVRPFAGGCAPSQEPTQQAAQAHGLQRIHLLRPPTLPRFPWMRPSGMACVRSFTLHG